jgi:hypothetical protein
MIPSLDEIKLRMEQINERIHHAAQSVGRDAEDVTLVVVTKTHPAELVRSAVKAGARVLGESYVDEAVVKIDALADLDVEWHMIGHIQSRKAKSVAQHFDLVHSLDRKKTANRLSRFAVENERVLPVLLQLNVSGEDTKSGWNASNSARWSQLLDELSPIMELPGLALRGLMTMAPYDDDPETARPYFAALRNLREQIARRFPSHDLSELSMGMSGDFEVAIQEGATLVRLGSAILGPRR